MIVYSANKRMFVQDVRTEVIATKILNLVRERGLNAGQDREFASWQNSMNFMRNIVDDADIDDEVQIAIEYNIPLTSKRVDFILIGADAEAKENFTLLNASVSFAAMKNLSLWARGENLLWEKYEINQGYPMPRATLMAGVDLKF